MITTLFIVIILINIGGLVPYVFGATAHLAVSLSIGLVIWLSLLLSSAAQQISWVVARLLPIGAPSALNPFLVIIETVRISVRPITLSVRLAANIRAGHIVLTLIGNYLSSAIIRARVSRVMLLLFAQVLYTMFEFGIAIIQAYIFCLLLTLYADEHAHV